MVVVLISARVNSELTNYENHFVLQIRNQYLNLDLIEILKLADFTESVVIPTKKRTKTIEKTFNKWELTSLNTCSRSFCTNQFTKCVPLLLIRKISGNKTENSFLKYMKVDEELLARR